MTKPDRQGKRRRRIPRAASRPSRRRRVRRQRGGQIDVACLARAATGRIEESSALRQESGGGRPRTGMCIADGFHRPALPMRDDAAHGAEGIQPPAATPLFARCSTFSTWTMQAQLLFGHAARPVLDEYPGFPVHSPGVFAENRRSLVLLPDIRHMVQTNTQVGPMENVGKGLPRLRQPQVSCLVGDECDGRHAFGTVPSHRLARREYPASVEAYGLTSCLCVTACTQARAPAALRPGHVRPRVRRRGGQPAHALLFAVQTTDSPRSHTQAWSRECYPGISGATEMTKSNDTSHEQDQSRYQYR